MISDRELECIVKNDEWALTQRNVIVMAKELLALRKAFSEPFCFTDNAGIDLWHMSESFEVWPEREGDISIPLFRKPVID